MVQRRSFTNYEPRCTIRGLMRECGVTLIEMIVVIAITAIVAAVVAMFVRGPVEGYVDAARRAELTDIADTALRRVTRDLRAALPNSIRVDGTGKFIEFLQTSGGGRYRSDVDSGGGGNILDFTNIAVPDTSFDVIGPAPAFVGGESIVVYNLSADPTVTTSNAYYGDNRGTGASIAGSTITFTPPESPPGTAIPFPAASPGKRFQVVQYAVTYHCDTGTGALRRYWNYTIQLSPQPTPPTTPPGSQSLLATNVTDCSFSYSTSGVSGRTGAVSLTLQIEQSNEKVRLFQQVHVSNVP